MKNLRRILCTILCFVMIFTTGITAFADTASAAAGDSALEDGTYTFGVMTSTKMFKITPEDNGTCQAVVKDGKITATIRLSGDGYSRLYIGPAEEAAALEASNPNAAAFIPYKKDADGSIPTKFLWRHSIRQFSFPQEEPDGMTESLYSTMCFHSR